ncbi:hypothetical protein GEMRC1_010110 [Eukaryota sp. GEM-RC1]
MISALANCNSLQEVNLTHMLSSFTEVLAPLFSSSSIENLVIPSGKIFPSVFAPLKCNLSLQELNMVHVQFDANDIADVLKHNTVLKRFEITHTGSVFTPIFKSVESNSSLKDLLLHGYPGYMGTFEDKEYGALCKMLRKNKSLLILNFPGSLMIFSEFTLIVEALKEHQVIKKVIMPYSFKSLSSFISDCETVCTEQFPISIDFGHHFTDVKKAFSVFLQSYFIPIRLLSSKFLLYSHLQIDLLSTSLL